MEMNIHKIVVAPTAHYDGNDTYIFGYKLTKTFFYDFIAAEQSGVNAIKDTYNRILAECKDNYKDLTEFVMVLNWRSWMCENKNFSNLYDTLWMTADEYATTHLTGEELAYFYDTTD